ncbi:BCCT family transporter [Paracoccus sp. 1_MG-2023]|uniref:BCCT family transporter n=1 Tax=unclassified Paracoccus (in: a-proteobacteria) TaxID=2688777 RepID=UPI001C0A22C5|nr:MULTISPECIES: BCCT family transporter [unclassified Paracoccus (in: a-proteobacteria)]MBU2957447.1 BCCT family transporter [Paracoccus sp. C2R09]MDO6669645.1 BCCT family transporter [Paracoccus sp. 1_MG-2023]
MVDEPPLMDLPINTADRGFYDGFAKSVAIPSKILVSALIVWAISVPENANAVLNALNGAMLKSFASWYIWVVALFLILCIVLALVPASGRLKLGLPDDQPEFTRFSWFSMMFGAGIGIGMLTFATAEPMYHFGNNPDVIMGRTTASAADNVTAAYAWSFLHWGLSAWACYALVGMALAYFSYRRNLPLTVRSALTPLFGTWMSGPAGHVVDIVAVVATILGVAQTLGFGVAQFVAGLNRIGFGDWVVQADGNPSTAGIVIALVVILGASTMSALSGVGKGVKWLSNLNMGLSFFLLAFFLIFGSTFFGLNALGSGLVAYVTRLPEMLFTVWHADGSQTQDALASWQGAWSVFYWAWWIAFAPFVGVFLARISRGRSIREYVLGAMIVPSMMCFVWFTVVGGTAIDLTLNGSAGDAISGAGQESQLFAMLDLMLSSGMALMMAGVVVVLLLTYLVTTADSAILIVNTINAAGEESPKGGIHIIFWGLALSFVVGGLLLVGGLDAIKTAMVIGALPFSFVMFLMCIALVKAVIKDGIREKNGVQSFHIED